MTLRITSPQISVIAHATEDAKKVMRAVYELCPEERFRPRVQKTVTKGHFGNPITTFHLTIRDNLAETFLTHVLVRLPVDDFKVLSREMEAHLDEESRLHLRINKQDCFRGLIRLVEADPIKIQVTIRGQGDLLGPIVQEIGALRRPTLENVAS
jgi:RNA binding exosome subunit